MTVFLLDERQAGFPSPRFAGRDGLLAVGGDLHTERLLQAYQKGIFPWFSEDDPLLWWSPDPRLVLYPHKLRVPRRLKRTIRQGIFQITVNQTFEDVVMACATVKRRDSEGTWITDDMKTAYCRLHEAGWAHSVETWYGKDLAGGLYGVAIGRCFFGESMFTYVSNASKTALVYLVTRLAREGFYMLDCQMTTAHLLRFGAEEIPRDRFLDQLAEAVTPCFKDGRWQPECLSSGQETKIGTPDCQYA